MAAAGGAAEGLFRCVFEGCISGNDPVKDRRPYHRNCGCALHSKHPAAGLPKCKSNNVSYPIRRACSEGSLVLAAASCYSSSSSSPVVDLAADRRKMSFQVGSCNEKDDDDDHHHHSFLLRL